MSRLYGRVEDVYRFYKYLIENYDDKFKKDNTFISGDELQDAPKSILNYLCKEDIIYLNNCDIKYYWNKRNKDVIFESSDECNAIFFPTKKMIEEYKSDLIYYIGYLLNERKLDYMHDEYDISCQFSALVPLLTQYLFYKENKKEERFAEKNLSDLCLNAPIYNKNHDRTIKYPKLFDEDYLLRQTLLNLVPLSSFDAALQIIDTYGNDKNEMRYVLKSLINNIHNNREEIVNELGINTYGFKRLRKEIDIRK